MRRFQWLRFLGSLGVEFWLPLPLIGLFFWLIIQFITAQNLRLSNYSDRQLEVNQNQPSPTGQILSIKVRVDRQSNSSQVQVQQTTSVIQKQEFKIPITESERLEIAIAKKLNLSVEQVRELIYYQNL
jgi:CYTH domain-containing protein